MKRLLLLLVLAGAAGPLEDPAAPLLRMQAGLAEAAKHGWPPPRREVERLVAENFDLMAIARSVLGNRMSAATPLQHMRLAHALGSRPVHEIMSRAQPPGELTVSNIRGTGAGEWIVHTETNQAGRPAIPFGWRIRVNEGRTLIVDVLRNGTSAAIAQHDDLVAALRNSDLDSVIADMERRSARELDPPPAAR